MDDEFPPMNEAVDAMNRMRLREENEQRVFSTKVDHEDAAVCRCELCPPRSKQEPADYCCRALFELELLKNGKLIRDGLLKRMKEYGSHSCIVKDPLFRNHIMNEAVSVSMNSLCHSTLRDINIIEP